MSGYDVQPFAENLEKTLIRLEICRDNRNSASIWFGTTTEYIPSRYIDELMEKMRDGHL